MYKSEQDRVYSKERQNSANDGCGNAEPMILRPGGYVIYNGSSVKLPNSEKSQHIAMNSQSSFNILPQDCWTNITDYLSFNDFLSLSTTCKDLRASTEHLLYREISWRWKALPLRRLLCLLRTTLSRPDLAPSVRHLSLLPVKSKWPNPYKTGWVDPGQDMDWSESSNRGCHLTEPAQALPPQRVEDFQDVIKKAVGIIEKAEFPDAEEWIDAFHNGNFHAFGAVLISQLPNIESLQLDFSFVWKGGFPGRMVKHAIFSNNQYLSSFESLQVVDYGGNVPRPVKRWIEFDTDYQQPDDFSTPCNQAQFIAWFYLPSVYRLEIWLRDIEELKAAPPDLSHLETLILARSTISEKDVLFLLTRTKKNLKNLHLGLCHEWETQPFYEYSDCLVEGLMAVRDTVERLSISLEYHPCVHGGSDEDFRQEESGAVLHGIFTQFPHLQTLEVPTALLFGFDAEEADLEDCSILPETLTELVLRIELDNILGFCWGSRDINDFVTSILHADSFPHLRSIISRSHRRYYSQDWPEEDWQMHQTCKESGIDFNIVVDHLGSGLWSQTGPIAKLYE